MTQTEFIEFLRKQVEKCGTQKEYASKIGVSLPYLNDVVNGRKEPGKRLITGAGFEKVITYRRKQPCN